MAHSFVEPWFADARNIAHDGRPLCESAHTKIRLFSNAFRPWGTLSARDCKLFTRGAHSFVCYIPAAKGLQPA